MPIQPIINTTKGIRINIASMTMQNHAHNSRPPAVPKIQVMRIGTMKKSNIASIAIQNRAHPIIPKAVTRIQITSVGSTIRNKTNASTPICPSNYIAAGIA